MGYIGNGGSVIAEVRASGVSGRTIVSRRWLWGVGVAGDYCLEVEKQILGFGSGGASGEHCHSGFHLKVENRLCSCIARGGFIVVFQ